MPHQRYAKAGIGAWQTLLHMPMVESERLPKEAAGPGLTSTWLPGNLEEETARRNSENIQRISRARPGRRPVRLETRWRGQADVAWDWNLTDLVGLGPVILKISPLGPGAGWARRRRLGPARPHLRELAPPAKTGGIEILDFSEFENITKRDIKRDMSATKYHLSSLGMECHES